MNTESYFQNQIPKNPPMFFMNFIGTVISRTPDWPWIRSGNMSLDNCIRSISGQNFGRLINGHTDYNPSSKAHKFLNSMINRPENITTYFYQPQLSDAGALLLYQASDAQEKFDRKHSKSPRACSSAIDLFTNMAQVVENIALGKPVSQMGRTIVERYFRIQASLLRSRAHRLYPDITKQVIKMYSSPKNTDNAVQQYDLPEIYRSISDQLDQYQLENPNQPLSSESNKLHDAKQFIMTMQFAKVNQDLYKLIHQGQHEPNYQNILNYKMSMSLQ